MELPDTYSMCNVDSSAEESTVQLDKQNAEDPSLATDQPENLETEPSSVKDGVAIAGVGDGVVRSSALKNEGCSSGVSCSTVKASCSRRVSAGYCQGGAGTGSGKDGLSTSLPGQGKALVGSKKRKWKKSTCKEPPHQTRPGISNAVVAQHAYCREWPQPIGAIEVACWFHRCHKEGSFADTD